MSKALWRGVAPINLPIQIPVINMSQLPSYPSLAECLERISVLSSQLQEDEIVTPSTSPLKRLVREVQELMQILSIHQNFSIMQPFTENQEKIQYMAFYDSLTRLPNRQFFEMYLRQLMQSANSDSLFYLIFLDLDGFKQINDTHGHAVGDKLLNHVAKRLRYNLRRDDIVARFGGDEFTILLNYHENQNLEFILGRLISFISEPYNLDNLDLKINVSLGVAKYPASASSYEELIKKADQAMYISKAKGNNLYTLNF